MPGFGKTEFEGFSTSGGWPFTPCCRFVLCRQSAGREIEESSSTNPAWRMNVPTEPLPEPSNLKADYNLRYVWLISIVAAMGGLLFGWDWVVIGGALCH
jgi:hypothetical protein